jgi:hypothetical protein
MAVAPQPRPRPCYQVYMLPNTYYERMKSNHSVYWPNIRLVLAITLKML